MTESDSLGQLQHWYGIRCHHVAQLLPRISQERRVEKRRRMEEENEAGKKEKEEEEEEGGRYRY